MLPTRGSAESAGLDLYSIEDLSIAPRQRYLARTGLAVAIPEGYYGRIAPRSGLALRTGLDVLSGVIDADYRGEIGCLLYNTGDETINLPAESKKTTDVTPDISQIVLDYTADKRIAINKTDVSVNELETRLRNIYDQRKDKTMFLIAAPTLR